MNLGFIVVKYIDHSACCMKKVEVQVCTAYKQQN